ncbi:hypothetical protein AB0C04_28990 [Micromonospora sp. NPDC048909]|uniref:hypothetical protein n=1 Tax=Micromonospora sp. NPDC048909 TaxID=3155643 RepID=UPI0033E5F161
MLKLHRPGFEGHHAEAAVLGALDGAGLAPRLHDVVDHEARTVLVLDRFDGPNIFTLLQRRPWRVLGLARALGDAHRAVHDVAAPADLPDLRRALAARMLVIAVPIACGSDPPAVEHSGPSRRDARRSTTRRKFSEPGVGSGSPPVVSLVEVSHRAEEHTDD